MYMRNTFPFLKLMKIVFGRDVYEWLRRRKQKKALGRGQKIKCYGGRPTGKVEEGRTDDAKWVPVTMDGMTRPSDTEDSREYTE